MPSDLFNIRRNNPSLASQMKKDKKEDPHSGGKTMSEETFELMRDQIYKLSGIYYTNQKKYLLESRIFRRIKDNNLNTFEEYLKLIKGAGARTELNQLFEAITINETFFFRAEHQFDALENIIIPEIIDSKQGVRKKVKLWSAASSSGEEAYTLAIIVNEVFKPKYPNVDFEIVASDINNKVLEDARKAEYREYAVRNMPENLRNKYFTKKGNLWALSDDIKRMVQFSNINLYDSSKMRLMREFDVIFCANVLIYFDLSSKQKVVNHIFDALNPGGYLFIGYSESLHGITKAFNLIHLPKAMAYKK